MIINRLFQTWIELAETGELHINHKYSACFKDMAKEISEEKFIELIEKLKKDFNGDSSYHSGVNDGMYHLMRHLIDFEKIKKQGNF